MSDFCVNIDDLINKNVLKLIINGKEYIIKDISMGEFLECLSTLERNQDMSQLDKFKSLIGLPADLTLGVRSYRAIVEAIMDWQTKADKLQRGDKATGNP